VTKNLPVPKNCDDLEKVVQQCSLAALNQYGQFQKAFMMASGIGQLRSMISDDMMDQIMPLMNTSLGFKTDKDPNQTDWKTKKPHIPYSKNIVKDCLIEAVLRGVQPVGNQFNIISAKCYITKEGFTHLLKNLEGLTELRLIFGVPTMKGDTGAIVEASATWKYNGTEDTYGPRQFGIKVNKAMGVDAIIGKCERKLRKSVYEQITGVNIVDGDVADLPVVNVTPDAKTSAADELNAQFEDNGEAGQEVE
jgi:hypothetical protein